MIFFCHKQALSLTIISSAINFDTVLKKDKQTNVTGTCILLFEKRKQANSKKEPIIRTSHAVDLVHVNHSTINLLELLKKEQDSVR